MPALIEKLKYYWKPTSMTFWVGLTLILSGTFRMYGLSIPGISDVVRPLLDSFYPASDPGSMIMAGFGFIGIRAALPGRS